MPRSPEYGERGIAFRSANGYSVLLAWIEFSKLRFRHEELEVRVGGCRAVASELCGSASSEPGECSCTRTRGKTGSCSPSLARCRAAGSERCRGFCQSRSCPLETRE